MKILYIVSGVILISIAILISIFSVTPTPVAVSVIGDEYIVEVIGDKEVYVPSVGTEAFAWEDKEWVFINTGEWAYPQLANVHGSLFMSENDAWMIVTMRGQIIEYASGGELPTLVG